MSIPSAEKLIDLDEDHQLIWTIKLIRASAASIEIAAGRVAEIFECIHISDFFA